MIYPTQRATILMAIGLPITLLIAVFIPSLWTVGAAWIAGVTGLIFLDSFLAAPRKDQHLTTQAPPLIYIGESENIVMIYENRSKRPVINAEFRLTTNQRLSAAPDVVTAAPQGRETIAIFDLSAKRRGEGKAERLWARWQGPLGLIWKQAQTPLDIRIPVISNIRMVKDTALEIFSRDAAFGQKIQQEREKALNLTP